MDVRRFFIKPALPNEIKALEVLAQNMWATWDRDAERLFHRLDPALFRALNHNPVELLYRIDPKRLKEVAKDKGFLFELKQVEEKFKHYISFEGTFVEDGVEKTFSESELVAYTCMEYGLHESLPCYSGGLAVLSGDILKAASDIGLPMVAFGLLYESGYFNQRITPEGNQLEEFGRFNWNLTSLVEAIGKDGEPVVIEVPLKHEKVFVKVWKIKVGKIDLYLLDTNIHQNPERLRSITKTLYDTDRRTRLAQELILGRGSVIVEEVLGIKPTVYHINEGHTAFLILERLLRLKRSGYSFEDARNIVRASTVFTTHTPIIEGNENFPDNLIIEYLSDEVRELGLDMGTFLSLGKIDKESVFWLPAFAIRFSRFSNGVSKIHAAVSRSMWRGIFATYHEREIPIDYVTNGVHLQSWLSLQMAELFDRYIGPDYLHAAESEKLWKGIEDIPDGEMWNAHCRRKEQVISFIRRRVSGMIKKRGYGYGKIADIDEVLNPNYLTIGFARRFAPYKRAHLILEDEERLVRLITDKEMPIQIVFSGKAHPADEEGKKIIKRIVSFVDKYKLHSRVVFIEDYDINVARHLVQGVDLWLNTPVRPMEASGTSGMKAAINGVLNLSITDGWWPEAYNGENGWAISAGECMSDYELSKSADANELYELLEGEIRETFYNRGEGGIPTDWVRMMKNSVITVCKQFNMHRVMREYLYKYYLPQRRALSKITEDNGALLKKVAASKDKIDAFWNRIYLKDYFTSIDGKTPVVGEQVSIDAYVYLDDASEDLVGVWALYCYGSDLPDYKKLPLKFVEKYQDKVAKYVGKFPLEGSGEQEISVCIMPSDPKFREFYPSYIKWKD